MRAVKVRHERLLGVGELFELVSRSGLAVTVISQPSGRRQLAIGRPGAEEATVTVPLTRGESAALAALLVGAHMDVVTTRKD